MLSSRTASWVCSAVRGQGCLQDFADHRAELPLQQHQRSRLDGKGGAPERLDLEAQGRQHGQQIQQQGGFPVAQIDSFGNEEFLGGGVGAAAAAVQLLVVNPFMGRMLVDDDQPLFGLAQQIGAPELADHVQARKPSLLP